ncbi:hypothetical protein O1C66_000385 [Vibrio cholerae]|nr:hypothetical protein [Vibrio cholerae]EJA3102005.1 hypothetical protein [Vibrio vulnificus]EGR0441284.1 hypothetical protein [Vibrio cholerae]EGR0450194.1 hypothetical protein [Vibrio cholerae]EGR1035023.1 hypothetical protein [Vibrio cholerae]
MAMSAHAHSAKDSHTLVYEARQMVGGLSAMTGAGEGAIEALTAEQLFFLFQALGEKLDAALVSLEVH